MMPRVTLSRPAADILAHAAQQGWRPPAADEVVTVRERTVREYLAVRRAWWIFWSLTSGVMVACLVMLARLGGGGSGPEAELAALWFGVFGGWLVLGAVGWRLHRAARLAELGSLDARRRVFHVEPAALVVEAPDGARRHIAFADLQSCAVEGHRARHGWKLTRLTLDDGAGPVVIEPAWLVSQRALTAIAARALGSGAVAAAG